MHRLFASYLRCFNRYAALKLKEALSFKEIGSYAIVLTKYSKALIERAVINGLPDHERLEREMCESGISFIKKFAIIFKNSNLQLQQKLIEGNFPASN